MKDRWLSYAVIVAMVIAVGWVFFNVSMLLAVVLAVIGTAVAWWLL